MKDRLALERMRTVDTVLFDKTGTLTRASRPWPGWPASTVDRRGSSPGGGGGGR